MNPPLRESPHSTWRMLVTRASNVRPEHVEAHLVADVDVEALVDALFDRHFGAATSAAAARLPRPRTSRR